MLGTHDSSASTPHDLSQSLDALERELTTLAGHLNAGNYRFLKLLAEFERREGHAGWGIASCAHWLAWTCGIGLVAAREKVRVARALEALPKLSEAMRCGVLSYCKVRALTRVATCENEDYLLYLAETGTVSHVEKTVRLYYAWGRFAVVELLDLARYWLEHGPTGAIETAARALRRGVRRLCRRAGAGARA